MWWNFAAFYLQFLVKFKKIFKISLLNCLSKESWTLYHEQWELFHLSQTQRDKSIFPFSIIMNFTNSIRWGILWTLELWSCWMLFSVTNPRIWTWLFRAWIWSPWTTFRPFTSWSKEGYQTYLSNQIPIRNFIRQENLDWKSSHSKTLLPSKCQ